MARIKIVNKEYKIIETVRLSTVPRAGELVHSFKQNKFFSVETVIHYPPQNIIDKIFGCDNAYVVVTLLSENKPT